MARRRIASGAPWEVVGGYSRALVVGDHLFVSGTVAVMPDGADPPPGAYAQAQRCLDIIRSTLAEAGATERDVVRTRMFLTRAEDADDVVRAHGEVFGEARPASTAVVVQGLIDPRYRVEIEAEAILGH